MAINLNSMVKALKKNLPGAIVDCTWARVTGSAYDPATGTMVNTTTVESFTGIKSEYRTIERLAGIESGDVQLIVDSLSLTTMPEVGAVITWGGIAYEVKGAKDYGKVAYDLQMRRK